MKELLITFVTLGLVLIHLPLPSSYGFSKGAFSSIQNLVDSPPDTDLKKQVFTILDTKCNVCHRKQNPFKIFRLKNMDKHAPKIYEQVFIKRRMPKGDKIKLTEQEYQTLKQWLTTKNLN